MYDIGGCGKPRLDGGSGSEGDERGHDPWGKQTAVNLMWLQENVANLCSGLFSNGPNLPCIAVIAFRVGFPYTARKRGELVAILSYTVQYVVENTLKENQMGRRWRRGWDSSCLFIIHTCTVSTCLGLYLAL